MSSTKEQRSQYNARHYANNKARYLEKARVNTIAARAKASKHVFEYLQSHPCVDCGECDPIVLEFDHVIGNKCFSISEATSKGNVSFARLLAEIEKCVVRCANCHRRKTYIECGRTHRTAPCATG